MERWVAASRPKALAMVFPVLALATIAKAGSAREATDQGNRLFGDSKYTEAISKYDEALVEQPQVLEPKFNKADSYYRMDDLGKAMDLYQEVAAGSKDMALVAKAKYNLGNCFFQRGTKQRDSDLQKAVDDTKTSITYWRQVLDIDPKNEKAARNIEVARLTIKDILDQLKKQQQQGDQNGQDQQQYDPNQPDQPQTAKGRQDPNLPENASESLNPNQKSDPNQAVQKDEVDESTLPRDFQPPDATAQEILDREQQQKKDREYRQRTQYQQVDKDW